MSERISSWVAKIEESSTIRMSKLSRELRENGIDIISLSLGEPDFDTPEHIKEAAIDAIRKGYSHYPPVAGYPELRQAIADKLKRENGLTYKASQTLVSNGAKHSLANIILSLLEAGQEIIVPSPYWVTYPEYIKLAEATMVLIETKVDSDFKITPSQLEAAITPKTRAFMFSSPSNPTGSIYSYEELKALAAVFVKYPEIIIISDEIYEHINFEGTHHSLAQFPELFERVVIVNGVSKSFAMTGWRIGYAAGPEWLIKACEKLQGQITSGANTIAQMATLAALTQPLTETYKMKDAFKNRRDLVVELLRDVKGFRYNIPGGAFYLFPDVSYYFGKSYEDFSIQNDEDLCMFLLSEARVSVVPGSGFGSPECIRISTAASDEELTEACSRIKLALAKLG